MRIGVASFSHESNSFYSQPTRIEDFGVHEGAAIIDYYRPTFHEIAGYIKGAEEYDFEIHPTLAANAMPAGPVTAEAYEHFVGRILKGIEDAPALDGILLALHGAMVAEGIPQADGETVRRVRKLVGNLPIAVTHDYHANVPPELVEAADVLLIYKTNPHIDQPECGLQAASILSRQIRGEVEPKMALVKPEVVFNIYFHNTSVAPMQPLMQRAIDLEAADGILGCSIAGGYQYADVPHMGPSIVVVSDGDQERAQAEAEKIGAAMWDIREQLRLDVPDPAAAVKLAIESEQTPVCLLEFGDNIGGGSSGDSTFVLEQLLAQGADGWVVSVWDVESVQACFEAGIGAEVQLEVGGKTDDMHGPVLDISGRVRTLHDGSYEEHQRRHGGGRYFSQGPTAVIAVGTGGGRGLLLLNSERACPNSIHQITCAGIAPEQQKIMVAKGAVAPRAAYEPVSARLIEVASGGATAIDRDPGEYELARKTLYEWR